MRVPTSFLSASLSSAMSSSASTSSSSSLLFVYGTLMAPQVMQTLIGRLPLSYPAWLVSPQLSSSSSSNDNTSSSNKNYYYSRHPVRSHVFPALIQTTTARATTSTIINGILYQDLTPNEWKILDWFEDKEYKRIQVNVEKTLKTKNNNALDSNTETTTTSNVVVAQTYLWMNPHSELDMQQLDWDYERFCQEKLDWYLEHTVRPCRKQVEQLGYCSSSSTS